MYKAKRALRRHHFYRLKAKRAKYYSGQIYPLSNKKKSMNVNTVPICSCLMCGNPRKYFKEITKKKRCPNYLLENNVKNMVFNFITSIKFLVLQ